MKFQDARAAGALAEFVIWFVLTAVISVLLLRLSVWLQLAGYGSVVLPVVVGGVLGITAAAFAGSTGQSARIPVRIGAAVLALVCVATQHLFFYFEYRADFAKSVASHAKLQWLQAGGQWMAPTFRQFLAASAQWSPAGIPSWMWWTIHALLTMVAAVAAAWWLGGAAKSPATLANP